MNIPSNPLKKIAEYTVPWLVLIILFTYSYAKFFRHPYGFGWEPNGEIYDIFTKQPAPTLRVGDQLLQVGSLTWDAFHTDLRETFFQGVKPGQAIPIIIKRDGQTIALQWILPGTNQGEILDQLLSEWILSYVFWLVGTLTLLFLHPKDQRWWLLSAFNFLTAIWLSAGSGLSNYHIWGSAIVLRMAIWLSVPIYLHLHWVFPRPLGKLPPFWIGVGYGAALLLMIAQWFQMLPQNLYFLGFVVAILGSLILLIAHVLRQFESRLELRVIGVAILLALAPLLAIAVAGLLNGSSRVDGFALISFPVLPFAYLYTAYRGQLGGLELRVNRLLSAYFFAILLGLGGIPLIAIADRLLASPDDTVAIGAVSAATAIIVSIWGFPSFEAFVERRWLGILLPTTQLPQIYSRRTAASTSINALTDLLKNDVLHSLLIRQFLFLRLDGVSPEILLAVGIDEKQITHYQNLSNFIASRVNASSPVSPLRIGPFPWVRLILPLKVGEELLGYWLFGRRDPDDLYPQSEIPILQSMADQTAIAMSNIIQTERLRAAYQADINRFEQERLRLALELHDSILNKIAAMLMRLDDPSLTPAFQDAYRELVQRLREIIKDLRPALLSYGLKSALEELADNLMERNGETVRIRVLLESNEGSYPQEVEQHLFRIVQEACTNALRHAKSTEITISGRLNPLEAELEVRDNGIGFDLNGKLDLNVLQANRHFGLTGILERAELIGADVKIQSVPMEGTLVQVNWKPGQR